MKIYSKGHTKYGGVFNAVSKLYQGIKLKIWRINI
jgi:hypothetical protein